VIIAIMGMLIDSTGILLIGVPLFTPILYPLGFDPLWFALIFAVMIQMSFISPPFAYAIFYLKAVAPPEITTRDMYIASVPFIVIQVVAIVFFCLFPGLITWLPSVL
jgi:TRAP-type mannitol/chloroaromatic compound transport system permease large subunit